MQEEEQEEQSEEMFGERLTAGCCGRTTIALFPFQEPFPFTGTKPNPIKTERQTHEYKHHPFSRRRCL
jgi:hypothetical protein